MTDSNLSVWTFHRTKLRTDGPIVAGATAAIFGTLMTMVVLHDQLERTPKVALMTAGVTLGLLLLTVLSREMMRRSGKVPVDPKQHSPLLLFTTSFLPFLVVAGLLARQPIESGFAYREGQTALKAGQFADASNAFSRYIEIHPTLAAGYFWRGKAEYQGGQLLDAYKDLKTAIKLQPRDVKSQVLLIGTLEKLGRDNERRTQLAEAERLNLNVRENFKAMLDEIAS